jgi:hypothetical protein
MRRCFLGLAVTSVLAVGQERAPSETPKPPAYAAQPSENALSQPNDGASKHQSFAPGFGLPLLNSDVFPPARLAVAPNTCAIPLLTVPANPTIDVRMGHKLKSNELAMDKMVAREAMPVCSK